MTRAWLRKCGGVRLIARVISVAHRRGDLSAPGGDRYDELAEAEERRSSS